MILLPHHKQQSQKNPPTKQPRSLAHLPGITGEIPINPSIDGPGDTSLTPIEY